MALPNDTMFSSVGIPVSVATMANVATIVKVFIASWGWERGGVVESDSIDINHCTHKKNILKLHLSIIKHSVLVEINVLMIIMS